MTPNYSIRSFQIADIPALMGLFDLNAPTFFAPAEKEDYRQYLKEKVEYYFVMVKDEALIGAGGINLRDDQLYLSWDLIDPGYHRQGLGSALLKHRLKFIEKRWPNRDIMVRTSQQAWQFYARYGFRLLKTEDNYWAPGLHLFYMKRESSFL